MNKLDKEIWKMLSKERGSFVEFNLQDLQKIEEKQQEPNDEKFFLWSREESLDDLRVWLSSDLFFSFLVGICEVKVTRRRDGSFAKLIPHGRQPMVVTRQFDGHLGAYSHYLFGPSQMQFEYKNDIFDLLFWLISEWSQNESVISLMLGHNGVLSARLSVYEKSLRIERNPRFSESSLVFGHGDVLDVKQRKIIYSPQASTESLATFFEEAYAGDFVSYDEDMSGQVKVQLHNQTISFSNNLELLRYKTRIYTRSS